MTDMATPGPWKCEGPDDFGDWNILHDGDALAIAAVVSNMRRPQETGANARLIAAAPDLIETLDDLIEDFVGYLTRNMDEPNRESITAAKAVLARAEGETP